MRQRRAAFAGSFVIAAMLVVDMPGQAWAKPRPRTQASGYDVSWPQCGTDLPMTRAFAIVGAGNGLAFSDNPCLASEYAWAAGAAGAPSFYMNTANPGAVSAHWTEPGPKPCAGTSADSGCA